MSGGGLAADSAGISTSSTGDGTFDATPAAATTATASSSSRRPATVLDYFTPHNQASLDTGEHRSRRRAGSLLLPDQPGAHPHEVISAGKDGTVYLVDRDNMGHFNADQRQPDRPVAGQHLPDRRQLQHRATTARRSTSTAPSTSPRCTDPDGVLAHERAALDQSPTSKSTADLQRQDEHVHAPAAATIAVSANGNSNGILWALQSNGDTAPGTLHAYDPSNLAHELYNSDQAGSRDQLDPWLSSRFRPSPTEGLRRLGRPADGLRPAALDVMLRQRAPACLTSVVLLAAGALDWNAGGDADQGRVSAQSRGDSSLPRRPARTPFLIIGDSPQALIGDLTGRTPTTFIANRRAAGFNALWVNLLCTNVHRAAGTTAPPTTASRRSPRPGPLDSRTRRTSPASTRWSGSPRSTAWSCSSIRSRPAAGSTFCGATAPTKDYAYGRFLGRRYKNFPNIVWLNGNDFQTGATPETTRSSSPSRRASRQPITTTSRRRAQLPREQLARRHALATAHRARRGLHLPPDLRRGAEGVRPTALLPFHGRGQLRVRAEHHRSRRRPQTLRRQEYWTMLSGATGQFYGNHYTWQFLAAGRSHIDTPGGAQLGYLTKLFAGRPWYDLVPDQKHTLVTSGYGTFATPGTSTTATTSPRRARRTAGSRSPTCRPSAPDDRPVEARRPVAHGTTRPRGRSLPRQR